MDNVNQGSVGKFFFKGLGLWNVYFILKFALAHYEYLTLNLLYNGLLLLFILLPFRNRVLSLLQTGVAIVAAFALVYSESWLPAGWGIMIDDVLAGIWALLCVSVVMAFIHLVFPGALTL